MWAVRWAVTERDAAVGLVLAVVLMMTAVLAGAALARLTWRRWR